MADLREIWRRGCGDVITQSDPLTQAYESGAVTHTDMGSRAVDTADKRTANR